MVSCQAPQSMDPCKSLMKKIRHSFTSRFLFSGVSSHLYYQDWTVDDLLGELAKQAIDAYEVGVLEPWIEYSQRFFKNLTKWLIIDFVHMCTYWTTISHHIIYYRIPSTQPTTPPGWFLCCSIRMLGAPRCAWSMLGRREIGYSYAKFLTLMAYSFYVFPKSKHNEGWLCEVSGAFLNTLQRFFAVSYF